MSMIDPDAAGAAGGLRVQLDGVALELTTAATLDQLLALAAIEPGAVATAVNGAFVPRPQRVRCVLADGDVVQTFKPIVGG